MNPVVGCVPRRTEKGIRMEETVVIVCKYSEVQKAGETCFWLNQYLQPKEIIFITNQKARRCVERFPLPVTFVDEDTVFPGMTLRKIKAVIADRTSDDGRAVKRAGWYFQQFLKMAYSTMTQEKEYLLWDADTIPTRNMTMHPPGGGSYFDVKTGYHKAYFDTMQQLLPELCKKNGYTFIAEHMLIDRQIMRELIAAIEQNDEIPGSSFWEKILFAIDRKQLPDSGFSEFETYGTYVEKYHPDSYRIRKWNSLREGTIFYPKGVSGKDLAYLSRRYGAISFENHSMHLKMQKLFGHPLFRKRIVMVLYQKMLAWGKIIMETSGPKRYPSPGAEKSKGKLKEGKKKGRS